MHQKNLIHTDLTSKELRQTSELASNHNLTSSFLTMYIFYFSIFFLYTLFLYLCSCGVLYFKLQWLSSRRFQLQKVREKFSVINNRYNRNQYFDMICLVNTNFDTQHTSRLERKITRQAPANPEALKIKTYLNARAEVLKPGHKVDDDGFAQLRTRDLEVN